MDKLHGKADLASPWEETFSPSLMPRYGRGPSRKECGSGRRTTDGVATRSSNALQGAWPVWPTCFNLEGFGLSIAIHRKLKFISSLNSHWEDSHLFSTEKSSWIKTCLPTQQSWYGSKSEKLLYYSLADTWNPTVGWGVKNTYKRPEEGLVNPFLSRARQ